MKRHLKQLKRVVSLLLSALMLATTLPLQALAAEEGVPGFNPGLVEAMAEYAGSQEAAEEALFTLRENGLIDKEGYPITDGTFLVDGAQVEKTAFEEMAQASPDDLAVNIDGQDTTWGDMKKLLSVRDEVESLKSFVDTGVEMGDEHLASLESLATQIYEEGVDLPVEEAEVRAETGTLKDKSTAYGSIEGGLPYTENLGYTNDRRIPGPEDPSAPKPFMYFASSGSPTNNKFRLSVAHQSWFDWNAAVQWTLDGEPLQVDPTLTEDGTATGRVKYLVSREVDLAFHDYGAITDPKITGAAFKGRRYLEGQMEALDQPDQNGNDSYIYVQVGEGETSHNDFNHSDKKSDSGYSGSGKKNGHLTTYITQQDAVDKMPVGETGEENESDPDEPVKVEKIYVQDGSYLPGETMLITVYFDQYVKVKGMELQIDRGEGKDPDTLTPEGEGTWIDNRAYFKYKAPADNGTAVPVSNLVSTAVDDKIENYKGIEKLIDQGSVSSATGEAQARGNNMVLPVSVEEMLGEITQVTYNMGGWDYTKPDARTAVVEVAVTEHQEAQDWIANQLTEDPNDMYLKHTFLSADDGRTRIKLGLDPAEYAANVENGAPFTKLVAVFQTEYRADTLEVDGIYQNYKTHRIDKMHLYYLRQDAKEDVDFFKDKGVDPVVKSTEYLDLNVPNTYMVRDNDIEIEDNFAEGPWKDLTEISLEDYLAAIDANPEDGIKYSLVGRTTPGKASAYLDHVEWKDLFSGATPNYDIDENGVLIPHGIGTVVVFGSLRLGPYMDSTETTTITKSSPREIKFVSGKKAFLKVPKTSKVSKALQGESARLLFSTNVPEKNTEVGRDEPVQWVLYEYSGEKRGKELAKGAFGKDAPRTIPAQYLTQVGENYQVELLATSYPNKENDEGKEELKDTINIEVVAPPLKAAMAKQESYYVMDDATVKVDYTLQNFHPENSAQVQSRVDVSGTVGEWKDLPKNDNSFTIDPTSVADLKDTYVVNLRARNSEAEEYSTDSFLMYVYNKDAIQIIVDTANECVVEDPDNPENFILSNAAYLEKNLTADGKSIQLTDTLTLDSLRKDLTLYTMVEAKFGSGTAGGSVIDRLKWLVEGNATLNYNVAGRFSNINGGMYDSFAPDSEFMLSAYDDGTQGGESSNIVVTSYHKNSGGAIRDEVTFESITQKDKLYLIQVEPKQETTLSYVPTGESTPITVKTDDTGAIALYEPKGIGGNINLFSNVGGTTYVGSMDKRNIFSGEASKVLNQQYPLNKIKLVNASETEILIKDDTGAPYANGSVTIRGGVYRNGEYAQEAGFKIKGTPGTTQSGRTDLVATTDDKGKVVLELNTQQFTTKSYRQPISASDKLEYKFELSGFSDNLYPTMISMEVTGLSEKGTASANTGIVRLQKAPIDMANTQGAYPFQVNMDLIEYDEEGNVGHTADVRYYKDALGPSPKYKKVVITADTMLWGVEIHEGTAATGDFSKFIGDDVLAVELSDARDDKYTALEGFESETTLYEFSSMAFAKSTYTMQRDSMDWLKLNDITYLNQNIKANGALKKSTQLPFMVTNLLDANDPTKEGETMDQNAGDLHAMVADKTDIGSFFGQMGMSESVQKGMMMMTGLVTKGKVSVGLLIAPTTDPMMYNIMVSIGAPPKKDGEGLGMDYSAAEDLAKMMDEAEDGGDDEGADVSFTPRGYVRAIAGYDRALSKWSFQIVGGGIGATFGVSKEWSSNFQVAFVPVTMSLSLGVEFGLDVEFEMVEVDGKKMTDLYTQINAGLNVDLFCGVGFDYGLIALKLGIYGKLGVGVDFNVIASTNYNKQHPNSKIHGQQLTIEGEIGLKFLAKILFIKYEASYALIGFSKSWKFNGYDDINSYWEGKTRNGTTYIANRAPSGEVMYQLQPDATMESRDYLEQFTRAWNPGSDAATRSVNPVTEIQTNAYPFANPAYADDAGMLFYLSDEGSASVEKTVAMYAKASGISYEEGKVIAAQDMKGDSNLVAAGTGDDKFAAWVRQVEKVDKESGDELKKAEVSMTMNASEIYAAMYDSATDTWETERLTENGSADISPVLAANGDKAVLVWRTSDSSNPDNPMDFNVSDKLMLKRFDGTKWSESAEVVYNGASGSAYSVDVAVKDNGEAVVAFTVKVEDEAQAALAEAEKEPETEAFYTVVAADGTVGDTVRLTNDTVADENIKATVISPTGTDQQFVLGWLTQTKNEETQVVSEDGTEAAAESVSDIRIVGLHATTNLPEPSFPESITNTTLNGVSPIFDLVSDPSKGVEDLAVVWAHASEASDGTDGGEEGQRQGLVSAVKFYEAGSTIGVTGQLEVANLGYAQAIDNLNAYISGPNQVKVALQVSDTTSSEMEEEVIVEHWIDEAGVEHTIETILKTPVVEGKMIEAIGDFTTSFEVEPFKVATKDIMPDTSLPLSFGVTNTGVTNLNKLSVTLNGGAPIELENPILPGQSTVVSVDHRIATDVTDVSYSIVATAEDTRNIRSISDTKSGTIALVLPDVALKEATVLREEGGKRYVETGLYTASEIPLAGSGKTLLLNVFTDAARAEDSEVASFPIPETDFASIDEGTYTQQFEIDLTKMVKTEEQEEMPADGVTLYFEAKLTDATNESFKERNTLNNTSFAKVYGLMERNNQQSFLIDGAFREQGDNYEVELATQNTSLYNITMRNVRATFYDAEDKEIGYVETYNAEGSTGTGYTAEEKKTTSLSIAKTELGEKTPAYVKFRSAGENVKVNYQWNGGQAGIPTGVYQVTESAIGAAPTLPADPIAEGAQFQGWFLDQDLTKPLTEDTLLTLDTTVYAQWAGAIFTEFGSTEQGSKSVITNTDPYKVVLSVPYGTDLSKVTPTFTAPNSKVTVDGKEQESGKTVLDFSAGKTVTYKIVSDDASYTHEYKVTAVLMPPSPIAFHAEKKLPYVSGTYYGDLGITFTYDKSVPSAEKPTTVYYTIDGSDPTLEGDSITRQEYTEGTPISVVFDKGYTTENPLKFKVAAYAEGKGYSAVQEWDYSFADSKIVVSAQTGEVAAGASGTVKYDAKLHGFAKADQQPTINWYQDKDLTKPMVAPPEGVTVTLPKPTMQETSLISGVSYNFSMALSNQAKLGYYYYTITMEDQKGDQRTSLMGKLTVYQEVPQKSQFTVTQPKGTSAGQNTGSIEGITNEYVYSVDQGATWLAGTGEILDQLAIGTEVMIRRPDTEAQPGSQTLSITIEKKSSPKPSPGPDPSPTPKPDEITDTKVIIDGKEVVVGKTTVAGDNTSVVVDGNELSASVDEAKENSIVQLPVATNKNLSVTLTLENIEKIAAKKMEFQLVSGIQTYAVPADAVDTTAILAEYPGADSKNIQVIVDFKESSATVSDAEVVIGPKQITMNILYAGKLHPVVLKNYITYTVELTEAQAEKISTAVMVEENGATTQLPTKLVKVGPQDEVRVESTKYYAVVSSRTNATVAFIQNKVIFPDIKDTWFEAVANEVGSRKIIMGVNGEFQGKRGITRAEFAVTLIRALGLSANGNASHFTDVPETGWYAGAVGKAYELGIIYGRTPTEFVPGDEISRQEAMVMVYRASKIVNYKGTMGDISKYPDGGEVSNFAKEAAAWSVGSEMIKGDYGYLKPTANITRAECATVVLRLLQKSLMIDVRTKV